MKYPEVAQRFSYILSLRDLTAQELADRSGVGKSSISHYLHGTHSPHSINAGSLAEVLNCDPMWLMGFDVPMEKPKKYGLDVGNSFSMMVAEEPAKYNTQRDLHPFLYTYLDILNDEGLQRLETYAEDLIRVDDYIKEQYRHKK